jgi:dihydrofolate reductase
MERYSTSVAKKEKIMAKVVIHTTLTLDGFMARLNHSLDWANNSVNDGMTNAVTSEIGAVVMGNGKYNPAEDGLPYGGEEKVPQFVVTHHLRDPVTVEGLTFTFVESIEKAISLAKQSAGDKSVMLLGASINQQSLNAGLVDEILLHVVPVVIGKGIRLFDNLKDGDIELERIQIESTEQLTSMRFRLIKS